MLYFALHRYGLARPIDFGSQPATDIVKGSGKLSSLTCALLSLSRRENGMGNFQA